MQEITIHGNQIELAVKRGIVMVHDKQTETISVAAGTNESGVATGVRTKTAFTTVQEFWLRAEDGTEEQIILTNNTFQVQAGQEVSLCLAGVKGNPETKMVGLVNHTTGETVPFPAPRLSGVDTGHPNFYRRFKRVIGALAPGVIVIACGLYLEEVAEQGEIYTTVSLVVAFFLFLYAIYRSRAMKKERHAMNAKFDQAIADLLHQAR